MELTEQQEHEIRQIMAGADCPRAFRCYKSGFENLTPVEVFPGNSLIQCRKATESYCPMSFSFGPRTTFCKCPPRKYVAQHLDR
ncbi:MAG: hypothetical protein ACYS74_20065 [Planctomycetota bacterium]